MNNPLLTKIESILFISNKPLSYKRLAELVDSSEEDIKQIIELLKEKYNNEESGIRLIDNQSNVQLATSPDSSEEVETFLKAELTGDMTRPQLETLTIIAYRGPILKAELEQIRGVNCSLILRNLLMRGLIESEIGAEDKLPRYFVTMDFLRFLGISAIHELPDYERLANHQNIALLLNQETESPEDPVEDIGALRERHSDTNDETEEVFDDDEDDDDDYDDEEKGDD